MSSQRDIPHANGGGWPRPVPDQDRAERIDALETDALRRMAEAEETLRAIRAGEVDAFVVSESGPDHRVFTLSTADRPYRMFVENMHEGAATVSSEGLILYANSRLAELLSIPREQFLGTPLAVFLETGVDLGLEEIRGPGGAGTTLELELVRSDGTLVPVLVGSSPLTLDGDELTCLTFTDLSAQKAQESEIARLSRAQAERMTDLQDAQAALIEQATHDSLTGLPNRGLLVNRINQALFQAGRSRRCTAVLFIDLDGFKQINDTQGHAAGDVTLQRVAQRLIAVLRPMDTVSRIGGDEFVVLAPDLDSHLHAVDIGTRLVSHLHDRREGGGPLTASIGISVSMAGEGTAETLLDEADTAMYRAKSLGGSRTEVFDSTLGRQVRHRSAAQRVLQSALDDHRLLPYYQPIVDLTTSAVTGFEALARITEPDGSILPPSEFIPVAEESGLVVPLGARVLEMACAEARGWHEARLTPAPLTVAVNTSSRQFEPGDLTALIRGDLETTGLDPAQLHLELTETTIMGLHPDIVRQLGRIRDLGVQIGLDDFGTGYASLTHLRRLPLTFVKIDRSFVQGLEKGHHDERIVSAVVDLAGNLGLRSIAEGVETVAQVERLREMGCDQGQGYLFARPMPPGDVPEMLSHPTTW